MGYFITFEGVEGCGKTTQIKLCAAQLERSGIRTLLTREPGGCMIADKIRAILLDAENSALSPMAELMLYAAARSQHVSEVISPAVKNETVVLCDRFCDATVAYQSFGRGIERSTIDSLNKLACHGITPDLTILFDCDPQTGLSRAKARIEACSGPREERFELEKIEFHEKVRAGYLQLASEHKERFHVVDASGTIEDIFAEISSILAQRINGGSRGVC